MYPRRHQSRDVSHVHHERHPEVPGHPCEALPVDEARVGAGAGEDEVGLELARHGLHLVQVDAYHLVFMK